MTPSITKHYPTITGVTSTQQSQQENPSANSDDGRKVYILGYGSLMQTYARQATAPDPEGFALIPVRVKDRSASWNLVNRGLKMRVLGGEVTPKRSLTGVIFETTKGSLGDYDIREGRNYKRVEVSLENVKCYVPEHQSLLDEDGIEVFMYQAVKTDVGNEKEKGGYLLHNPTSQEYKIFRSYLDIVLSGAHEIDERFGLNGEFCSDYLKGMQTQDLLVRDDRLEPQYSRHPLNLVKNPPAWLQSSMADYMEHTWPKLQERADDLFAKMMPPKVTDPKTQEAYQDVA